MKDNQQKDQTWIGLKDISKDPEYIAEVHSEFRDVPISKLLVGHQNESLTTSRRDFLKILGFSVTAASIAACDAPVRRAIPYVHRPEEIVPGVPTYYASTYVDGGDYCSILVKTREGRPIKIEGNSMSPITGQGTSARAQAHVLSLYDLSRFRQPLIDGAKSSWQEVDQLIVSKLNSGSKIGIISRTILSPTFKKILAEFKTKYPNTQIAMYDPFSAAAQLAANEKSYGIRAIPNYHFDQAEVIVSFNADFLGTWISPVEYSADYIKNRKVDPKNPKMSWHVQIENNMSLTGSNADNRILVKPSEQDAAIAYLCNALGGTPLGSTSVNPEAAKALDRVATKLKAAGSKSLIVSASNNMAAQLMVNQMNDILGNLGTTLDMNTPSYQKQGDERSLKKLISDMEAGSMDAVFVLDGNPAFDNPWAGAFKTAAEKVGLMVSLATASDETAELSQVVAPKHHLLESWGDAEPKKGFLSLIQPTISPLFDTRQAETSLLKWSGAAPEIFEDDQPYYNYLKQNWLQAGLDWDTSVHDGIAQGSIPSAEVFSTKALPDLSTQSSTPLNADLELQFYESINIGSGQHANNPWLQEMPDPVMRTVWGNYLSVPVTWSGGMDYDSFNDLKDGDFAELTLGENNKTVTVMNQFGQMPGTVGIALGYGRRSVGAAGINIGTNLYDMMTEGQDGLFQYFVADVKLSGKVGKEKDIPAVQYHHSMGVTDIDPKTGKKVNVDEITAPSIKKGYQGSLVDRSIIRRANLEDVETFIEELHEERAKFEKLNSKTLYPYEEYKENYYEQGHHWGLAIDLNACIGCGACTVSCMAENNVPVVGKREVERHHEMAWLRIDRYFYGDVNNPNTVYQPLMCQHCDNAPCENVCPVAATNHSSEGLNQMTYNRCIGTRYCANNCPYKVRRFNWLDYTTADLFPINQPKLNGEIFGNDDLTRMVLNPDVTVRSRGVIEKCSFCVQRIQDGKLTAKKEGRALKDGEIKSACQTACPTGAIVFGDFNNEESELVKNIHNGLTYQVLEEINVRPSVNYSAKIINRDHKLDA